MEPNKEQGQQKQSDPKHNPQSIDEQRQREREQGQMDPKQRSDKPGQERKSA